MKTELSAEHQTAVPSPLGEVLMITDLAPASVNAVWRAALVARERGASLRVLHAEPERGLVAKVHDALEGIGKQVHERLGIELHPELIQGDMLPKVISAARNADLLVLGSRRANPLRDWIAGTQAERLIRLCRIPTLVVKRPAIPGRNAALGNTAEPGSYGRVLVSVDLRSEAVDLINAAMTFSRDPKTHIFHALAARSGPRAGGSEAAGSRLGVTAMQKAEMMLKDLVRASGAHKLGAVATVSFGHAARCVLAQERALGAELIVIGKRQRGLLADYLMGGVTQDVLASSQADVLVMPTMAKP